MIKRIKKLIERGRSIKRESQKIYSGFRILKLSNKTPDFSYYAMRRLFVLTNGRSNDIISLLISKKGYNNINIDGVLGLKNRSDLHRVVKSLKKHGYHVFDQKLPDEVVEAVVTYAKSTPCKYLQAGKKEISYSETSVLFDENNAISPRYQFSQEQILSNSALQKIVFDSSLLAVAQQYLGTKPILDLIAMWWSVPFHGQGKSAAAQMYHFDLDRIKFLKFFFYLTDVDTNTGPHCYVTSSNKRLPKSLLKDGRLEDEEVVSGFGEENMMELCGQKGTIIAVDTRGLHKGKELIEGKRLLFQIEFANSMFGQYYPPIKKPVLPEDLEGLYRKYEYTYKPLMSGN